MEALSALIAQADAAVDPADAKNTAAATGVLFDGVKAVNTYLKENDILDPAVLEAAAADTAAPL